MDNSSISLFLQIVTLLGGGGAVAYYIKGMPERGRVKLEGNALAAKIEENLRGEAAVRFQEFRDEVHLLRNELAKKDASALLRERELQTILNKSVRRDDKLNMVLFIVRMVMDELIVKDPGNKTHTQANRMLARVEEEPHQPDQSAALNKAEDTVDTAKETVREIKAQEAKE